MAFDQDLDLKLQVITEKDNMQRKKMFGGTGSVKGSVKFFSHF